MHVLQNHKILFMRYLMLYFLHDENNLYDYYCYETNLRANYIGQIYKNI